MEIEESNRIVVRIWVTDNKKFPSHMSISSADEYISLWKLLDKNLNSNTKQLMKKFAGLKDDFVPEYKDDLSFAGKPTATICFYSIDMEEILTAFDNLKENSKNKAEYGDNILLLKNFSSSGLKMLKQAGLSRLFKLTEKSTISTKNSISSSTAKLLEAIIMAKFGELKKYPETELLELQSGETDIEKLENPKQLIAKSLEKQSKFKLPSTFVIPYDELEFSKDKHNKKVILGAGSFATVYKGKWQNINVAIKKLKQDKATKEDIAEFKKEAALMSALSHPNLLRLYGVIMQNKQYGLVMALKQKGSLYKLLIAARKNKNPLKPEHCFSLSMDIANGLSKLHQNNIVHRDIKSLNILIDENLRAVIGDFGTARMNIRTATNNIGSLPWMAPEMAYGKLKKYNDKCDVYSYAVVLYEILRTGLLPYNKGKLASQLNMADIIKGKNNGLHVPKCHKAYSDIMQQSWKTNKERPSIKEVIKKLKDNKKSLILKYK